MLLFSLSLFFFFFFFFLFCQRAVCRNFQLLVFDMHFRHHDAPMDFGQMILFFLLLFFFLSPLCYFSCKPLQQMKVLLMRHMRHMILSTSSCSQVSENFQIEVISSISWHLKAENHTWNDGRTHTEFFLLFCIRIHKFSVFILLYCVYIFFANVNA